MTKQISRYEAERVATLLEGFDVMTEAARERAATRAAAMLRSLMDRVEEYRLATSDPAILCANILRGTIVKPPVQSLLHLHGNAALVRWNSISELEAQLAAANERAEKAMAYADHLQDWLSEFSPLHEITKVRRDMLAETDQ